ncbi:MULTISPECIES: DUF4148 domain-containing protein [unclassified Paraburkholderia]|uniref:DUF4148 domain-containing protein n=1 Tax=unclassified Paraburkholderia TaxID=2615204 RepID=UPI0038B6F9C9
MLDLRPRATLALLLATGLAAAAASAVAAPPVGGTLSRSTTLSSAGKWSSPTATNDHGKTRARVYRELIKAEGDGQMNYLNQLYR